MTVDVKYTAHGTAYGGRNGYVTSSDGVVAVDLTMAKAFGGPGVPGATSPEALLATAFAASFGSAVKYAALGRQLHPKALKTECDVGLGLQEDDHYGFKVKLHVTMKGIDQKTADSLAQTAYDEICPFCRAMRGNVEIAFSATAIPL